MCGFPRRIAPFRSTRTRSTAPSCRFHGSTAAFTTFCHPWKRECRCRRVTSPSTNSVNTVKMQQLPCRRTHTFPTTWRKGRRSTARLGCRHAGKYAKSHIRSVMGVCSTSRRRADMQLGFFSANSHAYWRKPHRQRHRVTHTSTRHEKEPVVLARATGCLVSCNTSTKENTLPKNA